MKSRMRVTRHPNSRVWEAWCPRCQSVAPCLAWDVAMAWAWHHIEAHHYIGVMDDPD